MTADEPTIFQEFGPYFRARLMITAAIIFRKSRWEDWTYGHEKLMGVILWHYETKNQPKFKYSKLLKRHAYGRTQNYKLLKGIVDKGILIREPNGYYTFPYRYRVLIEKIFAEMKNLDRLGNPEGELKS